MKPHCAHCKSIAPSSYCGHCKTTLYCNQKCANLHYDAHIGVLLDVQVELVPPKEYLLLEVFMRDSGSNIPYSTIDIGEMLHIDKKDTSRLSLAIADALIIRRKILQNIQLTKNRVRWDEDTGNASMDRNIALGMLISPHVQQQTFNIIYPLVLDFVDNVYVNDTLPILEKSGHLLQLISQLSQYDDFVLNWGPLFSTFLRELQDCDPNYSIQSTTKDIVDIFNSHRIDVYSRYRRKNIKFEQVKSKFAVISLIPKGTFLYRSFADYTSDNGLAGNRMFDYFAFDVPSTLYYACPENHNQILSAYITKLGGISVFKTKDTMKILDLSEAKSALFLQDMFKEYNVPENVIRTFKRAWTVTESGRIMRNSGSGSDARIVEWICKLGFDGYVGVGIDGLHDEIMLCQPRSTLELVKIVDTKDNFYLPVAHIIGEQTQALLEYM